MGMCFFEEKKLCLCLKRWQVNNPFSNSPTTVKWPVCSYFYCYHLSVTHIFLSPFSCFLLSGLKELKQLYSNVLVVGFILTPISLFPFFSPPFFFGLMDFQRCIHDMVMKFKFVRHFLTWRKRLILVPLSYFLVFCDYSESSPKFVGRRCKIVKMWKKQRISLIWLSSTKKE